MMKNDVRRRIKSRRDTLPENWWKETSAAISEKFRSRPEYHSARCIMCYAAFGREADTAALIKDALASEKTVCVPKTFWNDKIIKPVAVKRFEDISFSGRIPQPVRGRSIEKTRLDIVIVPGIVFDAAGNRLGFGAGFYDRFLKDFRKLKAALAFDFQIVKKIPAEEWDVPVDLIITEKRVIEV